MPLNGLEVEGRFCSYTSWNIAQFTNIARRAVSELLIQRVREKAVFLQGHSRRGGAKYLHQKYFMTNDYKIDLPMSSTGQGTQAPCAVERDAPAKGR